MADYEKLEQDDDVVKLAYSVRDDYHQTLEEWKVQIDILMASGGNGPPVRSGGYAVIGAIKESSKREMALGARQLVITLDRHRFEDIEEEHQASLFDSLLERYHAERVKRGGYTLKRRKPDILVSGFSTVLERHGENSHEFMEAENLIKETGQMLLPLMNQPPTPTAEDDKAEAQETFIESTMPEDAPAA